jgi:hypothetical protein
MYVTKITGAKEYNNLVYKKTGWKRQKLRRKKITSFPVDNEILG